MQAYSIIETIITPPLSTNEPDKPDSRAMPWDFEVAFMRTLLACGWQYREAEYEYNRHFRHERTARVWMYGKRT